MKSHLLDDCVSRYIKISLQSVYYSNSLQGDYDLCESCLTNILLPAKTLDRMNLVVFAKLTFVIIVIIANSSNFSSKRLYNREPLVNN